jgi:hypothetical protein
MSSVLCECLLLFHGRIRVPFSSLAPPRPRRPRSCPQPNRLSPPLSADGIAQHPSLSSLACPCFPIESPSQTWPMHPQPGCAVLCPPCHCLEFPNPDMMLTGRPTLAQYWPPAVRGPAGIHAGLALGNGRLRPCRRHAIMTYPFRPGSEGYKRPHLDGFPLDFFLSTFN